MFLYISKGQSRELSRCRRRRSMRGPKRAMPMFAYRCYATLRAPDDRILPVRRQLPGQLPLPLLGPGPAKWQQTILYCTIQYSTTQKYVGDRREAPYPYPAGEPRLGSDCKMLHAGFRTFYYYKNRTKSRTPKQGAVAPHAWPPQTGGSGRFR